ncbi:AP-4 complex subunit sigma-1-like isoform X2 [Crassostrea angulata]|uniref:AP-4 complex subunit sigma-1 isoform X1 n=1 Tax=Magallana gigas TaxID=29159 RepID=UPI0022B09F48|nr:AP-4 complex subunit sigma-1-like isoform X2 [Crassostrea angulata]
MIHFLMVAGKQGKPRIGRFFTHQKEQISTQTAVIKLCLRDGKEEGFVNYEDMTLVYKLYVNVWFIVGVSHEENELAMFELFQNLVETLKTYLGKVTEVDIIFNMDRVYMIIDEMIIDGQIAETCSSRILVPLQLMDAAK